MAKSLYLRQRQLQSLVASPCYLAIYRADPTGGGAEISDSDYERQKLSLTAPVAGRCANGTEIAYRPATISWGTVSYVGVCTAPTGGELLYYSVIPPVTIAASEQLRFAVGDFEIEEG